MYCSSSSVFMTNKTPSSARKHRKGTKPRTHKTGQNVFLLSSSFFRWTSSILHEPLTLVYTQTAAFCM